jgi:hypothetical protein
LLDLGGFAPVAETSETATMPLVETVTETQASAMVMQNQGNAVNNAFDDFFGMSDPSPAPQLAGASSTAAPAIFGMDDKPMAAPGSSTSKAGKRPWMRATIKASHASGSPVVDWSKIQLLFRVYRANGDRNVAASIVARVENHMEMSMLTGLILRFKDHGDINIGDIQPGSSAESKKVGPFAYTSPDTQMEMKGTLVTPECSVSVKLSLPVSMYVSPTEGLALEDVAQQLSSGQWSSHSTKLDIAATSSPDKLKPLVASFLRMAEVEPGVSGPINGTFAGQSTSGAHIRVLVKAKKDSMKVDVKCTNPNLGKALISDLKRLVL